MSTTSTDDSVEEPDGGRRAYTPSYFPTIGGDLINRHNLLRWVNEWARSHYMGDYYSMEFGVLNGGGSIDIIRQLRGPSYLAHYGFDSFQGFGELGEVDTATLDLHPNFVPGNFKGMDRQAVYQNIKASVQFDSKLELMEGFFSESLPKFDTSRLEGFPLLFYVDCDLYASSLEVFEFIDPLIQDGTWILCDDYWCYRGHPKAGQRRAMDEWTAKSDRVGVTPYCNFDGYGRAFIAYTK